MSFLDTAAILANCDLLITSDSAVAHLGGAMGIPPGWLRWIPEWRWGLRVNAQLGTTAFFFLGSPNDGDWESVIQAMVATWMQTFPPK